MYNVNRSIYYESDESFHPSPADIGAVSPGLKQIRILIIGH